MYVLCSHVWLMHLCSTEPTATTQSPTPLACTPEPTTKENGTTSNLVTEGETDGVRCKLIVFLLSLGVIIYVCRLGILEFP